jgi:transcriptional regulator NrdR family protein
MKQCEHSKSQILDVRPRKKDNVKYRRRICLKCNKRFNTYEIFKEDYELLLKMKKMYSIYRKLENESSSHYL